MHNSRGMTLIELVVALALGSLVMSGVGALIIQVIVIPDEGVPRLVVEEELRIATSWLRLDANKAQSFFAQGSPTYGTFYWLDFSTYPPTRRSSAYFWDEGVLYRQPTVEGVAEDPIPLVRHIADPSDITFDLSSAAHALNPDAIEQILTVTITATSEGTATEPVLVSDSISVELRPEQTNPAEHRFFFLHNDPTPPVGDTLSHATLTMDAVAPTAVTLFNYDTDDDSQPGVEIRAGRQGGDLDEGDGRKFQRWFSPPLTATTTVDGRTSLFLSVAARSFHVDQLLMLNAWLIDYDPATDTKALIITKANGAFTSVADWTQISIHFRPTVYIIPPGHQIMLEVQVDGTSDDWGMVAYDTTGQVSLLIVPVQPGAS